MEKLNCNVCVIGAGAAGLSVASGAAQMGANVILIEKSKMGGDCLNYGCVPSKSILASAHTVSKIKSASKLGIDISKYDLNFKNVHDHIHSVIDTISYKDSKERFEEFGVKVLQGSASFKTKNQVILNDSLITAKYFVIATGSSPVIPKIKGLENLNFLTNETIFDLEEAPEHLIVLGGGPIGCELAQAFCLLGSKVTIIQRSNILPKDDIELVEVVEKQLKDDGIAIFQQAQIEEITESNGQISVIFTHENLEKTATGTHLLVSTGRKPDIENLNLKNAGIEFSARGISVDKRLKTSNKKIFALGDCAEGFKFTHMAGYQAGIVIKNMLFKIPSKINYNAVPWVTYTEPELAHIGMNEENARKKFNKLTVINYPFKENDRSQAERNTEGFIKIVAKKNGAILGVSIVGNNAGDLLGIWALAITKKLKIGSIASCILPYPTRGEINKQAASSFYTPMLFSKRTKKIVRFILRWF